MDKVAKDVKRCYETYPYPLRAHLIKDAETLKNWSNRFLNLFENGTLDLRNKKIIDAGCGTGEIACSLALNGAHVTGIDFSSSSIKKARELSKLFDVPHVKFMQKDIMDLYLPSNYFDYIFCLGVLHHTSDPYKGFLNLIGSLKVGGYIIIGLYSVYGRFRQKLKQDLIKVLAGKDIDKRIDLAEKIFLRRRMTELDRIHVADQYAHPNERRFKIEEILEWFEKDNIRYVCSLPPIDPKNKVIEKILGKNLWYKLLQVSWIFRNRKQIFYLIGQKK